MKKLLHFFLLILCLTLPIILSAQCTGGIPADTLNFTKKSQYISITGNHYYTFHADSGDRYFIGSNTALNPSEITILDSNGVNIHGYHSYPAGEGFSLRWKAPYTGIFRALTNLRTCQTDQVNLGSIVYSCTAYKPFPTDSAQWSIRHTIQNPFSQYSIQYKMKGDTILNGINYSKIYSGIALSYYSTKDTLHCFIREQSRKVYVKYPLSAGVDTSEILLYDFNLQVGDTFKVRLLHYETDSVFDFIVEAIDISHLITDTVTIYSLRPSESNTTDVWGNSCESSFNWFEGFGSYIHPFYNEIPQYSCENNSSDVVCLWHNNVYDFGGTNCDYTTHVKGNTSITIKLNIFPNPITDESLIEWHTSDFEILEIIDSKGAVSQRKSIENLNSSYIMKDEIPAGISFLRLIKKDGSFVSAKFLTK